MDVYYNKAKKRVHKIVATGNVSIENPDGNTTFSDNVIYLAEEGRIILGGDPEAAYFTDSKFAKAEPLTPAAAVSQEASNGTA
jgi:hypothetical protein